MVPPEVLRTSRGADPPAVVALALHLLSRFSFSDYLDSIFIKKRFSFSLLSSLSQ
jgi:hypothetical protein